MTTQTRLHVPRSTKQEMNRRREKVLALLDTVESLTLAEIEIALGLGGTQGMTLVNSMLELGDLVITRTEGRKRFFGRGDGVPPQRRKRVPYIDVLRALHVEDHLTVIGVSVDGIDVVTSEGREVRIPTPN